MCNTEILGGPGDKASLLAPVLYKNHYTCIHTLAHTQQFIENYPQFRKLSGTVSKHVAVVSELSRLVSEYHLMAVSECEQDLVTGSDRASAMKVKYGGTTK